MRQTTKTFHGAAAELKDAFAGRLRETHQHVERLEQILKRLGMPARGKKCEGMQHLIAEGNEMISEVVELASAIALKITADG